MKSIVKRIAVASMPVILVAAVACAGPAEGGTPPTISPDIFAPIPTPRPFGQGSAPTATPFVLPVPSATPSATSTIAATAVPTATPSATIGAPGPEPTSEVTVSPTVTPSPEFTQVPAPTQEPTSPPEPTTEPTATSTPVVDGELVFFLEEGSITLSPENQAPETVSAGVHVSDFSVAATFGNPVNSDFRPYSYGVKFREQDGQYQAVTINSAGLVRYVTGTVGADGETDSFTVAGTFDYDDVQKGGSDSNSIHLTVIDDQAWLFLNGEYIDIFTVDGIGISSDIQFIAELENETNISGGITELTAIEVRSASAVAFVSSGELEKVDGEVAHTDQTDALRDSLVRAEFVSPYELILGRWSVGFEYANPDTKTTNWFVVNNRRQWKHLRQEGASAQVVEVAAGTSTLILRDRNDVNSLLVVGNNGVFEVYINDVHLTELTFDPTDLPAQVSAIAGFEAGDQAPGIKTKFSNYTVWSMGS